MTWISRFDVRPDKLRYNFYSLASAAPTLRSVAPIWGRGKVPRLYPACTTITSCLASLFNHAPVTMQTSSIALKLALLPSCNCVLIGIETDMEKQQITATWSRWPRTKDCLRKNMIVDLYAENYARICGFYGSVLYCTQNIFDVSSCRFCSRLENNRHFYTAFRHVNIFRVMSLTFDLVGPGNTGRFYGLSMRTRAHT